MPITRKLAMRRRDTADWFSDLVNTLTERWEQHGIGVTCAKTFFNANPVNYGSVSYQM